MRQLEDAIVRLLKQRPFYGHFLLQFRRRPYQGRKAVAVTLIDALPTLMVSAPLFALFSADEQQALLEHLVKHILHLHPCRRRDRHPRLWDLACDLAINPGIEHLPAAAPRPERLKLAPGLAAEEYYDQLLLIPHLGNQLGGGYGDNTADSSGEQPHDEAASTPDIHQLQPLDDHQHWQDAERTPTSLSEQVVRQMVQSAWKKSSDETVGELRTLINCYLAPPTIPWQQILRQFIGTAGRVGKTSTWKRAHRRFDQTTPGIRKKQYLNLVVGIDVSDSTDTQPLRETFARELLRIAQARQSRITVLYAGSRIQKISSFSGNPAVIDVFRGGGFTDLRPIFDYARTMQPRPAAIIYLTDGFGPAPESSDIPTLWVLSPDGHKPVTWGLELRLDHLMEAP
jgi:predicted metal-dependent peptidase